jgi:hypothetical protein
MGGQGFAAPLAASWGLGEALGWPLRRPNGAMEGHNLPYGGLELHSMLVGQGART